MSKTDTAVWSFVVIMLAIGIPLLAAGIEIA